MPSEVVHARLRFLRIFACLCVLLGVAGVSPAAAAKKKSWPSKKHHNTHHHKAKPASTSAATKGAAAAPAQEAEAEDERGDEAGEGDDKETNATRKPKAKATKSASDEGEGGDEDGEREASADGSGGDDEGDTAVVRRKAKRPAMEEGGAPIALEIQAGPRIVHRTFDFNDPLSNHVPGATPPFSYVLPEGPIPFVDLAIYPAAFSTRGAAASFGVVAHFDKLIGTKTMAPDGTTFSTDAQQLEVGVRGRLALAEHELGLTASYGKQTFHVNATDPGPSTGTIPNVDYTFAGVGLDGRLRLAPVELGAHLGTRLVFDTGSLGQQWFSTVKTTSIDAGLSIAYALTDLFSVVGGVDFTRYGFDFNPVPTGNPATAVAGGAVDQYLSGYLALRVSLAGS